ncbi:DUF503 domain-containing protein [Calditerrivibrio nitroreducens]|uniref:DUF503 domain-containing protein n=1 Tax=Calditerrivibrio nitroreducens (strain DSM 19672 / NBRC 101217 / Yu37-1) TaxID=768670 RepID=E4TJE0_CALNY|nr:DUF503 domain-containing protein [Calditerrivibrio nitroreducens]ADR19207.1 protein of unknown function DUF503 [Calditerrivibrio nitroreducens DSM 19672]
MLIGSLLLKMNIPAARTLKDKRSVINSLKAKLRNKFNVSVAEVGDKDFWQSAEIAIVVVGDESALIDSQLQEVIKFVENTRDAFIVDIQQEIF